MRAIGNFACERLPRLDRSGDVALLLSNVAEVQVRGGCTRIDVDGLGKRAPGGSRVAGATLRRADFVGQKRENLLVFGAASAVKSRDFAAHPQRLGPLILLFVELLQVDQRVAILRIEPYHFLKGFQRTIDEPAMPEIERQAELYIRLFELGQVGPLEQRLMHTGAYLEARVRRRLPATLTVFVVEKEPVALADPPDGLVPLARDGRALPYDVVRAPVDAPIVPAADGPLLEALGRVQVTDVGLFADVVSARERGGVVVLDLTQGRVRLDLPVDPGIVRSVAAVRRDLEARGVPWRELDGRFRGWIVVRRAA